MNTVSRNSEDTLRRTVSESYARAVAAPSAGGCCSGPSEPKGIAVRSAGYSPEELATLPQDAVVHAFGCGNPLAFSEVHEGDVVLDLGSGAGIDLLLAARKVGPRGRVIGVDMTEAMIARARENIAAAGLDNIEVRRGIIEALPVETASVDWVISNCVINLSPEKPRVFAEIARVLRPGGRMRVSDIVVEELPTWARESSKLYSACVAGAVSEAEYVAGLEAAGLAEVTVEARQVYDGLQLAALIRSELPDGGTGEPELVDRLAADLAGKIWSARFAARRAGD
jgi:SAM-dependent methyltransferase